MATFYFPKETKVRCRTLYIYRYSIDNRVKKAGFAKGKKMESMVQYKHHDGIRKIFEFRKAFAN